MHEVVYSPTTHKISVAKNNGRARFSFSLHEIMEQIRFLKGRFSSISSTATLNLSLSLSQCISWVPWKERHSHAISITSLKACLILCSFNQFCRHASKYVGLCGLALTPIDHSQVVFYSHAIDSMLLFF